MKKAMFVTIMFAAVLLGADALQTVEVMSPEGVKCTYTHHDMWKGKTSGEGMLFLGMNGENEKVYVLWGRNKYELVQKEEFSLKEPEKDEEKEKAKAKKANPDPPWYQKFTDMLKKAVEWEKTADDNGLEDVQKPIALGWAYHKQKKGTPGWISRTWGADGKYELVEIRIAEIPKLLNLFEGVPDMVTKVQEGRKKLKDESDRKKAEEKEKKDKVDSLLK